MPGPPSVMTLGRAKTLSEPMSERMNTTVVVCLSDGRVTCLNRSMIPAPSMDAAS